MRVVLVVLAGLFALALAPPAFADNDYESQPYDFGVGGWVQTSNAAATIEDGEWFTAEDPDGEGCSTANTPSTEGNWMGATLWYAFTGTGRTTTIEAWGTDEGDAEVDTVIAVGDQPGDLLKCNDDVAPDTTWSSLRVPTVAGRRYWVQVGGLCDDSANCRSPQRGNLLVSVAAQPDDDNRASAGALAFNTPVNLGLDGATEETGEALACGGASFGRTRWQAVNVPAPGRLSVTATNSNGGSSVLALYAPGGAQPIACGTDPTGTSTVVRVDATVAPGQYLVQLGGTGTGQLAESGGAVLLATFAENMDVDGDGVPRPADCNDGNPSIRPGAPELLDDGIDQDCDGADAKRVIPPAVKPEVLQFTMAFDFSGATKTSTKLTGLKLRFVPKGAKVHVSCKGSGCNKQLKGKGYTKSKAASTLSLSSQVKATLKPGARIIVTVSRPGAVTVIKTLTIRPAKKPTVKTTCQAPGARRATACK